MKFTTLAAVSALMLVGVSASGLVQAQALVKVDGSSTVYPITEAVAEEFQKAKKNSIRVTVGISGTGGGFKKFCRGEIDISNASRPILTGQTYAHAGSSMNAVNRSLSFAAPVAARARVRACDRWLPPIPAA